MLPLERIRTQAEVSTRTSAGKNLAMAPGLSMKIDQPVMPPGPREGCTVGGVRDHSLMVWLVHILMVGGWALVGRAISPTVNNTPIPFVSFQTCWNYIRFVRERVLPLIGPLPDLRRCVETEKSVRLMLATSMQNHAMNMDQAMAVNETKMIALWDWTQKSMNANATEVQVPAQDLQPHQTSYSSSDLVPYLGGAVPLPPPSLPGRRRHFHQEKANRRQHSLPARWQVYSRWEQDLRQVQ